MEPFHFPWSQTPHNLNIPAVCVAVDLYDEVIKKFWNHNSKMTSDITMLVINIYSNRVQINKVVREYLIKIRSVDILYSKYIQLLFNNSSR